MIAGFADPRNREYLDQLRSLSRDLPISIETDLSREELDERFRKARFYWHGMGLGVKEDNPLKMEHFGMTSAEAFCVEIPSASAISAEAFSFGCVPIVIDRGGQKEIITEENGCRFSTEEELIKVTGELIRDKERTDLLARNALKSAERFSADRFRAELNSLLCE